MQDANQSEKPALMVTAEISRWLGCSDTHTRTLDVFLKPWVLGDGRRVYLRSAVQRYIAARQAQRDARLAEKAARR